MGTIRLNNSPIGPGLLKIFIVDEHPLMRQGYRALLRGEEGLCVCGEAENASEAIKKIPPLNPDLVIVDLPVHGLEGFELIKFLHDCKPAMPILVSSSYERELYGDRAQDAGASGYIEKSRMIDEGVKVIRSLLKFTQKAA